MQHWITLSFLLFTFQLFGQPANDDCNAAIDLGVGPVCDEVAYTNVGATASLLGGLNVPGCFVGALAQRDVWFSFTTADDITDYTIRIEGTQGGSGIVQPQIALYRGQCLVAGLAEVLCQSSGSGSSVAELTAQGLAPNASYFIRLSDYAAEGASNAGSFTVCIEEAQTLFRIDEDGSRACSGVLYDTGGPDGNYGSNERHVFTICPDQPNQCIDFTLDYYNIDDSGDRLTFYDGNGTNPATELLSISGPDFSGQTSGVSLGVQATKGCLTVEFVSDNLQQLQGFAGSWKCLPQPCMPPPPISLRTNVTPAEIAQALGANQTNVTITNIDCPRISHGIFTAALDSGLGLERGVLLSTGNAAEALGPNTGNLSQGSDNGAPGDADLDSLSVLFGNGTLSDNACIIELDVFATTDEIIFEYVFGSEEYPEFVGQDYNDIFAFLISGPGIQGEAKLNDQLNIATLPNAEGTVVQINSVNHEDNWEFYRNNQLGQSLSFDGLTSDFRGRKRSLTARAQVTPCNTYHLKLAIGDRRDPAYDSGVFIADLKSGTPEIVVNYTSGINYLVETCTDAPDELTIRLPDGAPANSSFQIVLSGTATPGLDYTLPVPTELTFGPGQQEFSFPITILPDLLNEGQETIIITLLQDFGCGTTTLNQQTLFLRDNLAVEINGGQDTARVCMGSGIMLTATGAMEYVWSPAELFDNAFGPEVFARPTTSGYVSVVGTLGNCTETDSIYLEVIDPVIDILGPDTISICRGDTVQLLQTNNVGNEGLLWTPTPFVIDPMGPNPRVAPITDTEFKATITLPGCRVSDSVFVDVDFLNVPDLIGNTTVCQNTPVQLAELTDPDTSGTRYLWSPATGLNDPTSPTPIATPDATTTYRLIATAANGACADTSEVRLTIIPSDLDILQGDTIFRCLGSGPITLQAATSNGSSNVTWSPTVGMTTPPNGLTVTVNPTRSYTYYVQGRINGCDQIDSIRVQIDSLPRDLSFTFEEDKDVYCRGERVIIRSPDYEPGDFPGITHQWINAPGAQTPDSLYNLVFNTIDTAFYTRVTVNGACVDTVSREVFVVEPPMVTITPMDTTVCAGEEVQYQVTVEGGGDITWEPATGLSCTECPNPVATAITSTSYMIKVESEEGDCDLTFNVNLNVEPEIDISVPEEITICPGETIRLLLSNPQPNVTYTWTTPSDPDFVSNDPLLTVSPATTTVYRLTAANSCGEASDEVTIRVAGVSDLTLSGPTQACAGEPVTFTAMTEATGGVTEQFTWIVNGQTVGFDRTLNTALSANSTVTLNYRFGDCTTLTRTVNVTVSPAPSLAFPSPAAICAGDNIVLNTAPDVGTTYSWSAPGGFTSTDAAPRVSPAATTTYSVTATTPGCPARTGQVTVLVIGNYTLDLPDDFTVCRGDSVVINPTLTPGDVDGDFSWSWTGGSSQSRVLRHLPTQTTTYTLTFTDAAGCDMATASVTVTVLQQTFFIDITATDGSGNELMTNDTVFAGEQVTMTANINPSTGFTYTYNWSGNGQPPTGTGNPFTVTVPTIAGTTDRLLYSVQATTDPGGCLLNANFALTILQAEYQIPEAFTPNGDNVNDGFRVFYNGIVEDFSLKVFNRWGQLVFESTDPDEAWDGTKNGKPQPADVYLYRAVFTQNGQQIEDTGEVMLVR